MCIALNHHNNSWDRYCHNHTASHFTGEETDTQRGKVTCLPNKWQTELEPKTMYDSTPLHHYPVLPSNKPEWGRKRPPRSSGPCLHSPLEKLRTKVGSLLPKSGRCQKQGRDWHWVSSGPAQPPLMDLWLRWAPRSSESEVAPPAQPGRTSLASVPPGLCPVTAQPPGTGLPSQHELAGWTTALAQHSWISASAVLHN